VECISDKDAEDGTYNGLDGGIGDEDDDDEANARNPLAPALKHLRMRDFNPYHIALALDHWKREVAHKDDDKPSSWHEYSEAEFEETPQDKIIGKKTAGDEQQEYSTRRLRRIITEPTVLDAKGIFKVPIKSALGYVEVVTAEKEYEATEIMIDDCRLLLLKVCLLRWLSCASRILTESYFGLGGVEKGNRGPSIYSRIRFC
jgi:hypothetical protein